MKITYKHSITKLGCIQVLRITTDKKGKKSNHRYILSPGNDITNKDEESIAIARLLWTSEIIKLYKILELIPPASVKFWKAKGKNFSSVEESKEAHSIRAKLEICVVEQYKKKQKTNCLLVKA
jgi:hypothetical protein